MIIFLVISLLAATVPNSHTGAKPTRRDGAEKVHNTSFALGADCLYVVPEFPYTVAVELVDSTQTWGDFSLHSFGTHILGIRCRPATPLDSLTVLVLESGGKIVNVLSQGAPPTSTVWMWNGEDAKGREVESGSYRIRFSCERGAIELPFCKRPGYGEPWNLQEPVDAPIDFAEPPGPHG